LNDVLCIEKLDGQAGTITNNLQTEIHKLPLRAELKASSRLVYFAQKAATT
jgi:hypothetical protein